MSKTTIVVSPDAPKVPAVTVHTWEHLLLHMLAWKDSILKLLDRNHDGKTNSDDLLIIFTYLKGWLSWAASNIPGWKELPLDQKIKKIGEVMTIAFPAVPGSVWLALEVVAHLGLMVYEEYVHATPQAAAPVTPAAK